MPLSLRDNEKAMLMEILAMLPSDLEVDEGTLSLEGAISLENRK